MSNRKSNTMNKYILSVLSVGCAANDWYGVNIDEAHVHFFIVFWDSLCAANNSCFARTSCFTNDRASCCWWNASPPVLAQFLGVAVHICLGVLQNVVFLEPNHFQGEAFDMLVVSNSRHFQPYTLGWLSHWPAYFCDGATNHKPVWPGLVYSIFLVNWPGKFPHLMNR